MSDIKYLFNSYLILLVSINNQIGFRDKNKHIICFLVVNKIKIIFVINLKCF